MTVLIAAIAMMLASIASSGTVHADAKLTIHDPGHATRTVIEPLLDAWYSGGNAGQWHVKTTRNMYTGTIMAFSYKAVSANHYRADVVFVDGRIFTAGFEL